MLTLLGGCQALEFADIRATATPALLSQWAVRATASSQYGLPDWSPNRAVGAPDVGVCADDARAWSSAWGRGVEWLELEYGRPVSAVEVRIHQTFGRGAVSRVTLITVERERLVVWEGEDLNEPCPGALTIWLADPVDEVVAVRVDLDESRTGTWNQIDAVELIGIP